MNIPAGHQTVMPYLILDGALNFIEFAKDVFDAEVVLNMHQMRDDGKTVVHSEIQIGNTIIMMADASPEWKVQNANLFIYVQSADSTYQKAIANGARTVMELSNQSYGRTCGVTDPFGNVWWITSVINEAK